MSDIQKLMNNLYAIPNNSKNELLNIILPFGNINESEIIVQVPTTTSQFQSKTNDKIFLFFKKIFIQ